MGGNYALGSQRSDLHWEQFPYSPTFTPQHHKDMTYALAQKCGPDEKPSSLDPRPGIDILRAMKLLHAGDMSTPLYFHYDVEGRSVIGAVARKTTGRAV